MFEDMVSFWIAMGVLAGLALWVPCVHNAALGCKRLREKMRGERSLGMEGQKRKDAVPVR